jgi:hypothetical protein
MAPRTPHKRLPNQPLNKWRALAALACILLLAAFTTASGVHFHTSSATDDPHCQLCFAAHAPVAAAAPVALIMRAVWTQVTAAPAAPRTNRTSIFDLNIRPPPTHLS